MRLPGGFDVRLTVTRSPGALTPPSTGGSGSRGWWPIVREPFAGAWQRNLETQADTVLGNPTVFACTSLIAQDVGKVRLALVEEVGRGIWEETDSPAFSPVLRKPNHYQTAVKFREQWMLSKLIHGNTYALKQRDDRGVVRALYILDPTKVRPLIAPDGSVFYELQRDDLAGLTADRVAEVPRLAVPAREVIHDLMVPLYHPLVGVSPIFACALAATQGSKIQSNSAALFANMSQPGGILTAPGAITKETAQRLKDDFQSNHGGANLGAIMVAGDGLKYEPLSVSAVDSQLIEQLKWTVETICSCYHVPAALIDSSHAPPYANSEPLTQQYYSQCLQSLMVSMELSLDEGLELPRGLGTAFDIDDLIWMDTATKTKAAGDAIGSGALTPNEARKKFYGLRGVVGGDTPYMQSQYYALDALAARDATGAAPQAGPPVPAPVPALEVTASLALDELGPRVADLFRLELVA